jgi:hypothetical protein
MNFYMNHGPDFMEPIARGLYLEIAEIEEQHVTQYESLLDPVESWFEQLVHHEYNECYLYHSFLEAETDERLRRLWELHLDMELGQLRVAGELLRTYTGVDPEEILPVALPQPTKFQENKHYVRQVLADQVDVRTVGPNFVPLAELPEDSPSLSYQDRVNGDGIPSEAVIDQTRDATGGEYRFEVLGPHPIDRLRQPAHA